MWAYEAPTTSQQDMNWSIGEKCVMAYWMLDELADHRVEQHGGVHVGAQRDRFENLSRKMSTKPRNSTRNFTTGILQ